MSALEQAPGIRPHALVVLRRGEVVAEGAWAPYTLDRARLVYSLSKSFTSTAVGLARAEGLIDLDTTVLSYFPELDADITDARSRAILVRHVAAMASGHTEDTLQTAQAADPTDLVRGFLLTPPDAEPGSVFAYNQPCTYTLAAIIQRAVGSTLVEYLRPRLLDPLGIETASWWQAPPGQDLGFSGLHVDVRAIAKLGELYRRGGMWGERRILDAEWVAEATRRQVDTDPSRPPDWACGYGFQFWMARHGYRGDGAYGQFCVVLPEQEMVVALTTEAPDMQSVLDLLWDHVLPAADRAGDAAAGDAAEDDVLATRLAALAFPALSGSPSGPPIDVPAEPGSPMNAVRATPGVGGRWRLELIDAEGVLELEVADGEWVVGETAGVPVAASGGWDAHGDLSADILFLDTPHALQVRVPAGAARAIVRWTNPPLHGAAPRTLRRP